MSITIEYHWWIVPILIFVLGYFFVSYMDDKYGDSYLTDQLFFGVIIATIFVIIGHLI